MGWRRSCAASLGGEIVKLEGPGKALNIFITEDDRWQGKPLHEQVLRKAHEAGLAGGTSIQGLMGFGASSHLHDAYIEVLMTNLPMSVLIVDSPEKIDRFLPELREMVGASLIETWNVNVEFYRHGKGGETP